MATEYKLSYSASDINTKLGEIDKKVNLEDVIDNLTTDNSNKPLSAAQGVALKGLIDDIDIPTKTSQLTNDSGFITIDDVPDAPVLSVNGKTGLVSLSASDIGALPDTTTIPTIPTSLKNPNAMTIDNQSYDGSSEVDFTNTISNIVDTKMCSVKTYGAVGDGETDDSDAFIAALESKQSVVFVPSGTYKLSKTIVITENSCLELSQDTMLDFKQASGNCIEMRGSAVLRGNHGNINVSSDFTGNVISVDTSQDGVVHNCVPPYNNSGTPLWKRQRFIYDVNITRTEGNFQGSLNGGHSGTALYISANYETQESYDGINTAPITCIWAMTVSGLRIGGAFDYGINVVNKDKTDTGYGNSYDPSWNHDMRIEAVIVGCETGVRLFNCNTAHLDVTVEPAPSINKVDGAYVKYAKNGIILEHSNHIDLSQSLVWDWDSNGTLVDKDVKNAHIALIGVCKGVILSDFLYHEHPNIDIREQIYTDTQSNFDSLIILQEPFTRWFKPIDNEPYFFNGNETKRLAYKEDIDQYIQVDRVLGYTDALANAIDFDGTIYNDIGYSRNGGTISGSGVVNTAQAGYYGHTGFIACKNGSTVNVEGIIIDDNGSDLMNDTRIVAYNSNFEMIFAHNCSNVIANSYYFPNYTATENGFSFSVVNLSDCAYIRMGFITKNIGSNPTIAINEEIKYDVSGFLADGINVKGNNLIFSSPNGIQFGLSVSDAGEPIFTKIEVS